MLIMELIRDNTNKKNITTNIVNIVGIPSSLAANLVGDIISIVIFNVIKINCLKIKNFGSFNLKKKKKRIGRNPKNKIKHEITERYVLTFKVASELRRKINIHVKK